MKCPYCGKEVVEGSKFCDGCGARLETEKVVNNNQNPYMYQPKKSKAGLIVAIIIISILLIAGIVIGVLLLNKGKDEKDAGSGKNNEPNYGEKENNKTDGKNDKPTETKNQFDNIKYTSTVLPDGDVLVFLENKGNSALSFYVEIEYYDNNNVEIDDDSESIFHLQPNKETVVSFYHPRKEYDNYKINIVENKYNPTIDRSKDITFTSRNDTEEEEIVVVLTNNSNDIIEFAEVTVVYYKDNKVVGYDSDSVDDFEGNKSVARSMYYPYDENFDTIDFDDYKVYLVYAYDYNFN